MTPTRLQQKDWPQLPRVAIAAHELRQQLPTLPGWELDEKRESAAITKTFAFANFYETMAFVNALALIAHQQDHHPDLEVSYGRCTVRLNTHDVGGISATDIDCARRINALLAA